MEHKQYQLLLADLNKAFPFLSKGTFPLAIGAGKLMRKALNKAGHSQHLVAEFIDAYFLRTEYRVSLINSIDDPDRTRFNLDGSKSGTVVSERDLYAVAFVKAVYSDPNISKKAKAYSRLQQGQLIAKRQELIKMTHKLCHLGFTSRLIVSKIGNKALPHLVECDWSSFQESDLDGARQIARNVEAYTKKQVRAFQNNMLLKGVPIQLINLASGEQQDYLYSQLFTPSKKKRFQKNHRVNRPNQKQTYKRFKEAS